LGNIDSDKWSVNVDFEHGNFDDVASAIRTRGQELTDSYDAQHATESTANFVLAEITSQPAVQAKPKLSGLIEVAKFLQAIPCCQQLFKESDRLLAEANIGSEKSNVAQSRRFKIPGSQPKDDDDSEAFWRGACHLVPRMADEAFPRGSWPWVTARELACVQLLDEVDDSHERTVQLVGKEFAKMAVRKDTGPLGTLLFVRSLQTSEAGGSTEFGAGLAIASLRDLSDDAFTRDIQLMTEGDHGFALFTRQAAESFGKLPADEQQRLIASMPSQLQNPLNRLATRRKNAPNEPTADSIKAVLLDTWHLQLRETVATALQRISTGGAKQWLGSTETASKNSPARTK
jgi:hypothetical protein